MRRRARHFQALVGFLFSSLALFAAGPASAQSPAPKVWIGADTPLNQNKALPADANVAADRGFIVIDSEPAVGGAKLKIQVFLTTVGDKVSLALQTVITDQNGVSTVVPLRSLDDKTSEPTGFRFTREYFISYQELQTLFDTEAPQAQLKIEPGMPLYVSAHWLSGHQWGGITRGGEFYLPPPLDANGRLMTELVRETKRADGTTPVARPTALDIGYKIPSSMTTTFNDSKTGAGLLLGGEVRSRVEGEGKFQLTEMQHTIAKQRLFAMTKDPRLAKKLLPPGWTVVLKDRYVLRDDAGNVIFGKDGLPIPDPMIDTYLDNGNLDAASSDMAIRYRWTEGNKKGAYNFKPGFGRADANGIVYRTEYGLDTTDDKPESLKRFADSTHSLNFFSLIRKLVPEAKPSDFFQPAMKLHDVRYKFEFKSPEGVLVEVSTDEVTAHDLRGSTAPEKFYQLEMDIDHLATSSSNTMTASSTDGMKYVPGYGDRWMNGQEGRRGAYLRTLTDKAYFDGRPVLHDASDLETTSALLTDRKADFDAATQLITALRDGVIGPHWQPGAQKYAYAAALLKLIPESRYSPSVKRIFETRLAPQLKDLNNQRQCRDFFKASSAN